MNFSSLMQNELLVWTNPVKSGSALAALDLAFVLYFYCNTSPLKMISNVGFTVIAAGAVARFAGSSVTSAESTWGAVDKNTVKSVLQVVGSGVNTVIDFARHVVFWEDQSDSLKVSASFYILKCVSGFMGIASVAFVVINLLFAVPPICKKQEKVINESLWPHIEGVLKKKDAFVKMIPRYTEVYHPVA